MPNKKRYCLEKLVRIDFETGTETWKMTKWCDDKTHVLETFFFSEGYRIYDTLLNEEVKRNIDLSKY
jgi:hypothetical protein